MTYDFIGCAKRLGSVLIGRTEPSVQAVAEAASELHDRVGGSLRKLWNGTLHEPVPRHLSELILSLSDDTHVTH